jgi:hypothetical protein
MCLGLVANDIFDRKGLKRCRSRTYHFYFDHPSISTGQNGAVFLAVLDENVSWNGDVDGSGIVSGRIYLLDFAANIVSTSTFTD